MLAVFLVEDEVVVRESIRNNFPWEENGFTLVGEAQDGELALPLIEELRPDIVITDIKMPFMDGLELSRILKKSMPWTKIIILSGHDEFTYAKSALEIGVTDYILKPIGPEDLKGILDKARNLIEVDRQKENNLIELQKRVARHTDLLKERFLSDLAEGLYTSSEAREMEKNLELNITARYYCIGLISLWFNSKENSYGDAIKAESILQDLSENNDKILKFKENAREICLLFRGNDETILEEDAYRISQAVKSEIEKQTNCRLSISLGSVRERFSGISRSMGDARIAAGFDYIFGNRSIIGISDTNRISGSLAMNPRSGSKIILDFLQTGNLEEMDLRINEILSELEGAHGNTYYYAFAFTEIISTVSRFIEGLGEKPEEILPQFETYFRHIGDFTIDERAFSSFLREMLAAAMDLRNEKQNRKYGDIISKAKDVINRRFHEGDLSLADIASEVNLSAGHFSTIFSQETGNTFIECLTAKRISKSKELLKSTSKRVSEIAFEVGYNDSHYFSYIFKQKTGTPPGAYRKDV